ncbi:ogr/Delta-like zinc finger family protein [Microbulbifer sp. TYP-18]|uniref:ogr/Delta-like zinc finger family protein n=1 Tax=Microbulbifer sp. TYP-18 TaxID=3230024 RepID=UPI0034C6487A
MQINCTKCGSKAIITSRKEMDPKLVQLYCACKNVEHCGHTFVMDLAFRHTLSPSSQDRHTIVLDMLQAMPAADRQALLRQVEGQG